MSRSLPSFSELFPPILQRRVFGVVMAFLPPDFPPELCYILHTGEVSVPHHTFPSLGSETSGPLCPEIGPGLYLCLSLSSFSPLPALFGAGPANFPLFASILLFPFLIRPISSLFSQVSGPTPFVCGPFFLSFSSHFSHCPSRMQTRPVPFFRFLLSSILTVGPQPPSQ